MHTQAATPSQSRFPAFAKVAMHIEQAMYSQAATPQ
jgi:hypothetical protein